MSYIFYNSSDLNVSPEIKTLVDTLISNFGNNICCRAITWSVRKNLQITLHFPISSEFPYKLVFYYSKTNPLNLL